MPDFVQWIRDSRVKPPWDGNGGKLWLFQVTFTKPQGLLFKNIFRTALKLFVTIRNSFLYCNYLQSEFLSKRQRWLSLRKLTVKLKWKTEVKICVAIWATLHASKMRVFSRHISDWSLLVDVSRVNIDSKRRCFRRRRDCQTTVSKTRRINENTTRQLTTIYIQFLDSVAVVVANAPYWNILKGSALYCYCANVLRTPWWSRLKQERCATCERVQSFVYIYSECYAIIQVIKKEED